MTKKNVFYLNVVLSFLLLLSSLFVVRNVISDRFEKKAFNADQPAAGVSATWQKKPLEAYAPILKNNPFGFPGGDIRALTQTGANRLQRTDFVLVGTVVGPRELSYAVFRDNSGRQEVFKVGDLVFGAEKLYAVKRDRVFLGREGATTEIQLEDVRVEEISRRSSGGASPPTVFARRIGGGTYLVDQARLQQAIANPGQMMTDARLRPHVAEGREEGFLLSEVKPGGIYDSLGLRNGDVLLKINEYDVSNPEKALQAFTALRGMDRVQIDLIRGGSKMTMTYQIK